MRPTIQPASIVAANQATDRPTDCCFCMYVCGDRVGLKARVMAAYVVCILDPQRSNDIASPMARVKKRISLFLDPLWRPLSLCLFLAVTAL